MVVFLFFRRSSSILTAATASSSFPAPHNTVHCSSTLSWHYSIMQRLPASPLLCWTQPQPKTNIKGDRLHFRGNKGERRPDSLLGHSFNGCIPLILALFLLKKSNNSNKLIYPTFLSWLDFFLQKKVSIFANPVGCIFFLHFSALFLFAFFQKSPFPLVGCIFCGFFFLIFRIFPGRIACMLCHQKKGFNRRRRRRRNFLNRLERPFFLSLTPFFPCKLHFFALFCICIFGPSDLHV